MNSSLGVLLFLSSFLYAQGDGETLGTHISQNIKIFWNEPESKIHSPDESHERQRRIQPDSVTVDIAVLNISITTPKALNSSESVIKLNTPIEKLKNSSETVIASEIITNITGVNKTSNDEKIVTPPSIFPENPDRIITDLPNDEQNKLNHYKVGLDGTKVVTPNAKLIQVQTKPLETTLVHDLTEQSALKPEFREQIIENKAGEVPDEIETDRGGISSGITALISTLGFAVLALISLLAWRRYQEYLHGNRELLVNDFDANDFNNFEL